MKRAAVLTIAAVLGAAAPAGASAYHAPTKYQAPKKTYCPPTTTTTTTPPPVTGNTGPTGATGATGAQGATGPVGEQGLQGQQGATGAPGLVGESFVLATGPQGATGPAGPAGASAPASVVEYANLSQQSRWKAKHGSTYRFQTDDIAGTPVDLAVAYWHKMKHGYSFVSSTNVIVVHGISGTVQVSKGWAVKVHLELPTGQRFSNSLTRLG